jgi:ATP-dependent DNA helicase DinG
MGSEQKNSQHQFLRLIFSQNGLLSRFLNPFEERPIQIEMARHILEAYEEDQVALIEAGTGTGKSLAYLVPAVFWALKHQEKTVITTHTIALQEQLLHKDIPFLLKTMDVEVKACLVKGMSNYLCLRKLQELQDQPLLFSSEETKEVQSIEQWAGKTDEGSRSDIPFPISPATWEKIGAEGESCNHIHCPHYRRCFFFKARKEATEAQILVVNHHLLLADIEKRRRNPVQESILPPYYRLIVDEAHNLEDIALNSFAERFDRIAFLRLLSRLHSDTHPERSRLNLFRQALAPMPMVPPILLQKLEIEIPALRRICQTELEETFAQLSRFFEAILGGNSTVREKEMKMRITDAIVHHPFWKDTLIPELLSLSHQVERLSLALKSVLSDVEEIKSIYEKLGIHLLEIQAIAMRLEQAASLLAQFVQDEPKEKRVRWLEFNGSNVGLVDAALDVSNFLNEHLFANLRTSILCSATMATARSFNYLKARIGLSDQKKKVTEEIYDSPFNYAERALFIVPTDLPLPSNPDFLPECTKAISEAIDISKGSAFVLFTSYEMLQSCFRALANTPSMQKFPFLKQGDLPRHHLLDQFKKREGNVLFATDSFWEGVDVPGEALRCVIIAKLPFSVPSDPLYEAYAQSLEKEGLNPFSDYAVPQAVIKFKQGFGRLMRKNDDRGCIVCLDHRIVKKSYGKQFLQSLPNCHTCFAPKADAFARMRLFYERTKKLPTIPIG